MTNVLYPRPALVFSSRNTVTVTKFAISVPAETMKEVDRAAKRLRMTRSRFISIVLARVARRQGDRAISKKVDAVLAELDEQDFETLTRLQRAGRSQGTEW
jgi:hypothetical protein